MDDATMEDLTSFADIALYQAKDAGRNQAVLYDPAHGGRNVITALQQKRTSILDALDNRRLTLYRQPIYGVESRKLKCTKCWSESRRLTASSSVPQILSRKPSLWT